ncbi:MAG: hypothetical protein ACP5XB_26155 [Isosphaeraceae bacterium]
MSTRKARQRGILSLESLEIRTAPSHVSTLAHAFAHVQHIKPPAHVERIQDTQTRERNQSVESRTGTDPNTDTGSGSSATDTSPNDVHSKDPRGQS